MPRSDRTGAPRPPSRGSKATRYETLAAAPRGFGQTLEGSFSAVSTPNFANKYAFESSCRDLYNALLCTALQSQLFGQNLPKTFAKVCKFNQIQQIHVELAKCNF